MHQHGQGYYPCTGMNKGIIHAPAWTRVLPMHRHGRGYYPSMHRGYGPYIGMDEGGTIHALTLTRQGTILTLAWTREDTIHAFGMVASAL